MATKKAVKKVKKEKKDKYVVVDPANNPFEIIASGSTPLALEKGINANDYVYDMDQGDEWVFDLYEKVGTVSLKKPVATLVINLKK